MKCPKCGSTFGFYADINASVFIKNGVIDEILDFEFDDDHLITCENCGHDDEYENFVEDVN